MSTTIFDLDYTLLDTTAFKKKLASIFSMSEEDFNKSYETHFVHNKRNYDLKDHLEFLKGDGFIDDLKAHSIKKSFEEEMETIDSYLFEGALKLILSEKSKGNKISLVSFGNKEWQKEKFQRIKSIKDLFDEIRFEEGSKEESEYFQELKESNDNFVIINDNLGETKKMVDFLGPDRCEVNIVGTGYSSKQEAEDLGYNYFEELNHIPIDEDEPFKESKIGALTK